MLTDCSPSRFHPAQRLCACIVLAALLAGCTKTVERPEIETRHLAVDWEHSETEVLAVDGLNVRGIVLTPAQWPLEGSLKRLVAGDFVGVIDALDLTFHSSTLPEGALRDVYDQCCVPVYVRVSNPGTVERVLSLLRLQVSAEPGRVLNAVEPEHLPYLLRRIDWERTAIPIAAALFIVAAIVAGRNSNLDRVRLPPGNIDVAVQVGLGERPAGSSPGASYAMGARPRDPGVLQPGVFAPGDAREGFVFFSHSGLTVDWKTAHLAAP